MAEEVVTRFILDTQQYDQALRGALKGMEGYSEAADDAAKSNKELDSSLGSATARTKEFAAASDVGGKALATVGSEASRAFPLITKVTTAVRVLGTSIKAALGPVGLVVAAIVAAFAALLKVFVGTQEGADKLRRVLEPLKAALSATLGLVQTIAKAAFDALRVLGNLVTFNFSGAADAFDDLKNSARAAIGEISNFGGTLAEAVAKGAQIARIKEQLQDLAITLAKEEGRITRAFAEQLQLVQNVNATASERKAAAEEAIRLQKELLTLRLRELNLQIRKLRIKQSLNDTSNEELLELTKLEARREDLRAEFLQSTRRVVNTVNSLNKQQADKAIEQAKRVAEERRKLQEQRIKGEQDAADLIQSISDRSLEQGLRGLALVEFQIEQRYDRERKAAEAFFAAQAALFQGNAQEEARIARQKAQVLAELRGLQEIEEKQAQERIFKGEEDAQRKALDVLEKGLATRVQAERIAINERFDALRTAAEQAIVGEEELTVKLVEIEQERQGQLAAARTDAELAAIEAEEIKQQARLEAFEQGTEAINGILAAAASGQEDIARQAAKTILTIAVNTVEKLALAAIASATAQSIKEPDSVATFGATGITRAAILTALIKAATAGLKGLIAGAYTGERNIGEGERPLWSGRDGFLRRVDKGEDIIASKRTRQYRGELDAIHQGRLREYIAQNYAFMFHAAGASTSTTINRHEGGTISFSDKGIVGAIGSSAMEERRQTAILAHIAKRMRTPQGKRYYA